MCDGRAELERARECRAWETRDGRKEGRKEERKGQRGEADAGRKRKKSKEERESRSPSWLAVVIKAGGALASGLAWSETGAQAQTPPLRPVDAARGGGNGSLSLSLSLERWLTSGGGQLWRRRRVVGAGGAEGRNCLDGMRLSRRLSSSRPQVASQLTGRVRCGQGC